MRHITLLTATLLIMTGCNDDTKQEIKETAKEATSFKTVQYYLDHKDLREARLKECRYMTSMTYPIMTDCNNAGKADLQSKRYKYTDWSK